MKFKLCFALLSLSALPACFSSTGLDEDGCEANPCTGNEVASCAGSRECEELAWCGTTIFCDHTRLTTPATCTEPRPVCADSVEVAVCPAGANCFPFEWCGQTFYCASEACDELPPECAEGEELSGNPCEPGNLGCRAIMACFGNYYCRQRVDCVDPVFEPCAEATSTVWATSEGQCSDFDNGAYCYESLYCGSQHFCVTACAQGDEEVFHPSECVNTNDCYAANPWRDDLPQSWCQGGGGPACRAIPTCDGGDEIPLDALCDDDGYCEYRSVCSTTIQCYFQPIVAG